MFTYQIMIPQNRNPDSRDNTGASYLPEIGRWETYLLTTYGGFTRLPACHGAWRDPKTGTIGNPSDGYRHQARAEHFSDPGVQAHRRAFEMRRSGLAGDDRHN